MVAYYGEVSPAGVWFRGVHVVPEQIRQYFKDESFYAADVNSRGLCGELVNPTNTFTCEAFSPSSATVKVRTALYGRGSTHPHACPFSLFRICLGKLMWGFYHY